MIAFSLTRFFSHRVTWLALGVSLGIGALFAHTMWSMHQEHWDYQLRTNTNLSSTLAKGLEWSLDAVDMSVQKTAIALQESQGLQAQTSTPPALLDALWRDMKASGLMVLDIQGRVVDRNHGVASTGRSLREHDFFRSFLRRFLLLFLLASPPKICSEGNTCCRWHERCMTGRDRCMVWSWACCV